MRFCEVSELNRGVWKNLQKAETEDNDQRDLGPIVHFQIPYHGNWNDSEENIGRDIDSYNTVRTWLPASER
jgi:hypothetical protein